MLKRIVVSLSMVFLLSVALYLPSVEAAMSFVIGSSGGMGYWTETSNGVGERPLGQVPRGVNGLTITAGPNASLVVLDRDNERLLIGNAFYGGYSDPLIWMYTNEWKTVEWQGMSISYICTGPQTQFKISGTTTVKLDVLLHFAGGVYSIPVAYGYTSYYPLLRLAYKVGWAGGGAIQGESVQLLRSGESGSTVTAVPNSGYYFAGWSDGNTNAIRTDTNVTADRSVTATFYEKKNLIVQADAKTKVYGESDPPLTYQMSGLDAGDSVTVALSRATGQNAGNYLISADISASEKYNVIYGSAQFSITKKTLKSTVGDYSKVYGSDNPSYAVEVTGFVNGETAATAAGYVAPFAYSYAGTTTWVGNCTIYITSGQATNYAFDNTDTGTLTITPKTLTPAPWAMNKVYDGTTLTDGPIFLGGVVGSDYVSATGTFAFADANVGYSKQVTVTGITLQGSHAANYVLSSTTASTTANITPRSLTIKPADSSKTYGDDDPAEFPASYSGLAVTDSPACISGLSISRTEGEDVGQYTLTASGATATNYTITYQSGTFTINLAPLRIKADNQCKVYGQADSDLTVTYSGFRYLEDESLVQGLIITRAAGEAVREGGYAITLSGATADNYAVSFESGILTINKAPLTVTAGDKSKVYGADEPVLTYTPSGTLYFGDDYSVITGVTLSAPTGASATAGNHVITAGGGSAANYEITHVNGALAVSKAELVVTADNRAKVYGAAEPVLTYTPSGTLYYDDAYSVIAGVTLSAPIGADASVGTHTITPGGGGADNYSLSYVDGTLTVQPASLTISADNVSKLYGKTDPDFTVRYSGFQYLDGPSVVSGLQVSREAGEEVKAGGYIITPSGATASNYTISFETGTLDIHPAPLTIKADNQSKVYGEVDPELAVSYSGFQFGEGPSVVSDLAITRAAGEDVIGGGYTITPSGAIASNYVICYQTGTLTISKAPLTISADDKHKDYDGVPYTDFTVSYLGLVADETEAVLAGELSFSGSALITPNVGEYEIIPAGLTSGNYDITFVPGCLTIAPRIITAIGITAHDKYYDGNTRVAITTSTAGLSDVVDGDDVTLDTTNAIGSFITTLVGDNKPVRVTGLLLTGADAGNYALAECTIRADIVALPEPVIVQNPGGTVAYSSGRLVTVTPDEGYYLKALLLDGWSVGSRATYRLSPWQLVYRIEAQFEPLSSLITIKQTNGGTVTVSEDGLRVVIAADRGYRILDVLVDGQSVGAVSSYTFDPPAAVHEVEVKFERLVVAVSVIENPGGTVTVSEDGLSVTITPDQGYRITNVLVNGTSVGPVTSYLFTQSGDYSLEARFRPLTDALAGYTDANNHWAKGVIAFAVDRGLLVGTTTTTFSPNQPITRAMLVTVLMRLHGGRPETRAQFSDVTAGAWYAGSIAWAVENGIAGSVGNNAFAPNRPATREELAQIVINYCRFAGIELPQAEVMAFSDISSVSPDSRAAVTDVQQAGLMGGRPGNLFDPQGNLTRAEFAAVLYRLLTSILNQ